MAGLYAPPPADTDTVLYVGRDPDALRTYFDDVRTVGDIGDDMHAYLLTGHSGHGLTSGRGSAR